MNISLRVVRTFSYCNLFLLFASLIIFSSCQKDGRSTTTSTSLSTDAVSMAGETESMSALASKIDTSALVAWYSFDNGSVRDISLYHNKVIFNNATPTTDRNGVANNAYYFDGSSSYMEVKNSPSLNPDKEVTLFAIARFDDFYEGKCHGDRILFKGFNEFDDGAYYLGASDGYYTQQQNCYQPVDKAHESFETKFGNTGVIDTTQFVQTGHWYHLVYTFGKGTTKFYVDGNLVSSVPQSIMPASNSYNLYFGVTNINNTGYPYWFTGSIDQIGIFNRALNANQVARLSSY